MRFHKVLWVFTIILASLNVQAIAADYPEWLGKPDSDEYIGVVGYASKASKDDCKLITGECNALSQTRRAKQRAYSELTMRYISFFKQLSTCADGCDKIFKDVFTAVGKGCWPANLMQKKEQWQHPKTDELFVLYVVKKDKFKQVLAEVKDNIELNLC